jgi:hypothetical protein
MKIARSLSFGSRGDEAERASSPGRSSFGAVQDRGQKRRIRGRFYLVGICAGVSTDLHGNVLSMDEKPDVVASAVSLLWSAARVEANASDFFIRRPPVCSSFG